MALAAALSLLGQEGVELSVLFVGSRRMKTLNSQYRGIPRETDVLSFPMEDLHVGDAPEKPSFPLAGNHSSERLRSSRSDKTGKQHSPCASYLTMPVILGDIVISIPRTLEQARDYGTPFYEELFRLLVHGLLHLLGYDHEKGRYQKMKMEKKEKEILYAIARLA